MTIINKTKKTGIAAALTATMLLPAAGANAGGTITFGDDKSVTIGIGLKNSFSTVEGGAPDGSRSADFSVDSVRIYLSGQLNDTIKGTFNTDRAANGDVHILDAFGQFEFNDAVNLWIGRIITPGDRANMSGGYYQSTYFYPGVVSQYPGKYAGRDDGAAFWGKILDKRLVYSAAVFMGHNRGAGLSNAGSNPLFTGRIQYSFLDPELDPGYLLSSTYYGGAGDILTLGFAGNHQKDGVGTSLVKSNYTAWNVDLLYESKMASWGSVTLEGAYYNYDTNNVADVAPVAGDANIGGISDGKAYFAGIAYTMPNKFGWGLVQPYGRFQQFDNDITSVKSKLYNLGFNYVIDGHNAKISADYGVSKVTAGRSIDAFTLGLILQF